MDRLRCDASAQLQRERLRASREQQFFDTDALHRGLFRLEYAGKVQTAVFSPDKPRQQFALAGSSRWRQFLDFNREGVWHIWSGYDHILFLLALLLPSVLKRGPDGWR